MAEFAEGLPVTVQSMEDVNYTFNYTHMVMLHYTVNQLTVLRVKFISNVYIVYIYSCYVRIVQCILYNANCTFYVVQCIM